MTRAGWRPTIAPVPSRVRLGASVPLLLLLSSSGPRHSLPPAVTSPLEFTSADPALTEGFQWAKGQALAYVMDGDPVGPWYEAALPGREAFCMRDVAHQSMGAHALGLAPYTRNMLHRFAENIAESRDWASYWEIDRYNRPAPVDYRNDAEFWYNLPANFDILDAAYRMYLWTGDRSYVADPVFLAFYDRTVTDYVARWDLGLDVVMHRTRFMNLRDTSGRQAKFGRNRGIPSYIENDEDFTLGVDLLATMYAAYRSYAQLQEVRGQRERATAFHARADSVQALVNRAWWDERTQAFRELLGPNGQFTGRAGQALLYRGVTEPGPKTHAALQAMRDTYRAGSGNGGTWDAVEVISHEAEILYRYGQADEAYARLRDLTAKGRSRREYPEVSYSVIGAIVTGTMGVTIEAAPLREAAQQGAYVDRVVRTLPSLGGIPWAELRHLPIRRNDVAVRHEGNHRSRFSNLAGPALIWQAAFPGAFDSLRVNGKAHVARRERDALGGTYSWVRVPVGAGDTVVVETDLTR